MRFSSLLSILVAGTLALAGCSSNQPSNSSTGSDASEQTEPSFAQFADLPAPDDARIDVSRTLVLGQGDNWVGRVVFTVHTISGLFSDQSPDLFDFFKSRMPKLQWQEISSVRGEISVMTYRRGNRVATVQIEDTTFGAEVVITVGPANGNPQTYDPNQPPMPAGTNPPPTVTEQPLK